MSGQNNEVRGIRNIRAFITADALLAAILLVWAQFWIQPSIQLWVRDYGKGEFREILDTFNFNVGLGLGWTYFAVVLALFALIWAGWHSLAKPSDRAHDIAIGLFAASAVMGVLDVLQSFASIIKKLTISGMSIYKPIPLSDVLPRPWGAPCFIIVLGLLILGLSLWGACKHKYKCWMITEGVVILIAGGTLLYFLIPYH